MRIRISGIDQSQIEGGQVLDLQHLAAPLHSEIIEMSLIRLGVANKIITSSKTVTYKVRAGLFLINAHF